MISFSFSFRRRAAAILVTLVLAGTIAIGSVPFAGAQTASGDVQNAAPTFKSATLYTAAPTPGSACTGGTSASSFTPAQNSTRTIHMCAVLSDGNGWNDVCASGSSRTYTVKFWDGVTTVGSKTGSLTCATGSGSDVALTANFSMEYWRWANASYSVALSVQDVPGASVSQSVTFEYQTLTALRVINSTIGFGSLSPGAASQRQVVALNEGNVNFTVHAAGPSAGFGGTTYSQSIPVGSMQHGSAFGSETTALTGSAATTSVSAPIETSSANTGRIVYLKFTVPTASGSAWTPADAYSGTLTFTAAAS